MAGPIRKEQSTMTTAERKAFTDAVLAMKKNGSYDRYVRDHNRFFAAVGNTRWAHVSPSFLPWHRQFLINFEKDLQRVSTPNMFLPYWDWSRTGGRREDTLWSDQMMGTSDRNTGVVNSGPFRAGNWSVVQLSSNSTSLVRRQQWNSSLPTASQVRQVLSLTNYDASPYGTTPTNSFRNNLEGFVGPNLHNRVHVWVGGHMAQADSPNDPLFFLHHCFIDKLWADWQKAHPTSTQYVPAVRTGQVIGLRDTMQPFSSTPEQMLDHTRFYTYA